MTFSAVIVPRTIRKRSFLEVVDRGEVSERGASSAGIKLATVNKEKFIKLPRSEKDLAGVVEWSVDCEDFANYVVKLANLARPSGAA
ncbi:hypothetical protein KPH14_004313 [Odynerus spinipes]|uniref:Uncharacterized protein n=1 Tax=Odynerus spinipes TaxID=1348599 RepID=A0AAD9RYJ4_9HYME|nr:hypothetical protein KPH14_004313 [Odynerus spinipes]